MVLSAAAGSPYVPKDELAGNKTGQAEQRALAGTWAGVVGREKKENL